MNSKRLLLHCSWGPYNWHIWERTYIKTEGSNYDSRWHFCKAWNLRFPLQLETDSFNKQTKKGPTLKTQLLEVRTCQGWNSYQSKFQNQRFGTCLASPWAASDVWFCFHISVNTIGRTLCSHWRNQQTCTSYNPNSIKKHLIFNLISTDASS